MKITERTVDEAAVCAAMTQFLQSLSALDDDEAIMKVTQKNKDTFVLRIEKE